MASPQHKQDPKCLSRFLFTIMFINMKIIVDYIKSHFESANSSDLILLLLLGALCILYTVHSWLLYVLLVIFEYKKCHYYYFHVFLVFSQLTLCDDH